MQTIRVRFTKVSNGFIALTEDNKAYVDENPAGIASDVLYDLLRELKENDPKSCLEVEIRTTERE